MEIGPAAFAAMGAEFTGGVETTGFAFTHDCWEGRMLVERFVLEGEGRIVGAGMLVGRTVGGLDGSGYEGNGMEVVWAYRLMCDRSVGGKGLRRWRDVVCRWTIDQKS